MGILLIGCWCTDLRRSLLAAGWPGLCEPGASGSGQCEGTMTSISSWRDWHTCTSSRTRYVVCVL